jgi:hypothetical protein
MSAGIVRIYTRTRLIVSWRLEPRGFNWLHPLWGLGLRICKLGESGLPVGLEHLVGRLGISFWECSAARGSCLEGETGCTMIPIKSQLDDSGTGTDCRAPYRACSSSFMQWSSARMNGTDLITVSIVHLVAQRLCSVTSQVRLTDVPDPVEIVLCRV